LAGGEAVQITQNGGVQAQEAPDGRRVYFSRDEDDSGGVWCIPEPGGQEELILPLPSGQPVDWRALADGIVYCQNEDEYDQDFEVVFHSFASGQTTSLFQTMSITGLHFDVHPPSGDIFFEHTNRFESDIVGLENF